MPTCMCTHDYTSQCLIYTTSWFGSPEVNKLVARAGLHALTAGKYLIGPGNTKHRGCHDPAFWLTFTPAERHSARGHRQYIGWPQISMTDPDRVSRVPRGSENTQGHTGTPNVSLPAVLLQFPSTVLLFCFCPHHSPPSLPPPRLLTGSVRSNSHCSYCNCRKRAISDSTRNVSDTLPVKGIKSFGPWVPRVGVYNEENNTRGNSLLFHFRELSRFICCENVLLFLNVS